uniref:MFS domain-containing protein n=1 Tax=Caenorhabditis japonica TaxID=281687 RepID=A0A8R1EBA9_CAEJA
MTGKTVIKSISPEKNGPPDSSSESSFEPSRKSSTSDRETSWQSIYLLTAIGMFCGIQFSIFFPTLWPFLNTVDPTASASFFGFITAAFSVGQGLASPAFGYWMNRAKSVRQPLVFGISVMILSNIIFCFVEAFKEKERRWVMMVARFFIGVGAGTVGVMRAYAATASSLKDRARAITFIQASYVIGMTLGPGIQVAFTPIGYPGLSNNVIHVDLYTAPAWFASIVSLVSVLFIFIFLEENYAGVDREDDDEDSYTAMPAFDTISVAVCVLTQFTLMFIITNLETIGSLYAKMMWGWTNEEAVLYTGILQAVNGLVGVLVYALFAVKLGDYLSNARERIFTIFGLALGVLYHVITYPYPWGGDLSYEIRNVTIHGKTQTEELGCNPAKYHWCKYTKDVNFWIYATMYGVVLAACFPIVNISMNTLFSKMLGPRRQGTMQGIMLMSGSFARTVGPMLVSWIFQDWGPEPIWGIEILTLSITAIFWIIFYRRMTPLESNPKLDPYEHFHYAKGVRYRM